MQKLSYPNWSPIRRNSARISSIEVNFPSVSTLSKAIWLTRLLIVLTIANEKIALENDDASIYISRCPEKDKRNRAAHEGSCNMSSSDEAFQRSMDVRIGARVQQLRLSSGLTLPELAERLGIPQEQYKRYELGEKRIGPKMLVRIADALGVKVARIFDVDAAQHEPQTGDIPAALKAFLMDPEAETFAIFFNQLTDTKLRRNVLDHMKSLIGGGCTPVLH